MEGIGNLAQLLGPDFQVHLIDTLYAVLEKRGSEVNISENKFIEKVMRGKTIINITMILIIV